MIYGGGDIAVRSESGAEPGHHEGGTAGAVREQDQRKLRGSGEDGGVGRGLSGESKGRAGRANPLLFLDGGGIGGIPDVGDEGVRLGVAPVVRLWRDKLAVHYADFLDMDFSSGGLGRGREKER